MNSYDEFMSYDEFVEKYQFRPYFTTYHGLVQAITKIYKGKDTSNLNEGEWGSYYQLWHDKSKIIKLSCDCLNIRDHSINSQALVNVHL